jgi:hypothetical protein
MPAAHLAGQVQLARQRTQACVSAREQLLRLLLLHSAGWRLRNVALHVMLIVTTALQQ